jgi:peptidoglycan/xylan/chitin deacetylase (PgdA/CDA1 family)
LDRRITERRAARREVERQRQVRRRRRTLALSVVALVALGAGVAVGAGGGANKNRSGGRRADATEASIVAANVDAEGSTPTVAHFHDAVPILMYHAIQPAPFGAAEPDLFVPEGEFEDEMRWLSDHGYNGVTLDQVFAAWDRGAPIPAHPVVVSFDDGLQSQYAGARPMLERLHWPGVLNLAINHLDSGDITAAEVRELISEGWELDAHTFSHVDVTTLDPAQLEHEVGESRTYLQHKFGVPVDFFCYPAGAYDEAAIQAVKAAGYLGATTTEEGLATPGEDPELLSRVRVKPGDGANGLAEKVAAGPSTRIHTFKRAGTGTGRGGGMGDRLWLGST